MTALTHAVRQPAKIVALFRIGTLVMRATTLQSLLLVAGFALAAPALAGVGATSAGVTTNIPNQDPTQPSANVQDQSAGFVQQNQQLQNGALPPGITLPGGATGSASGQANASHDPNSPAEAAAEHRAGTDPHAPPAAPAAPPPPPPTYVSVIKPVTRIKAPDAAANDPANAATNPAPAPATKPAVADKPAPKPTIAAKRPVPARPAPTAAPPAMPAPVAATGGRGAAPDGFAFYAGTGIALALLAFAFSLFLRIGKDESAARAQDLK